MKKNIKIIILAISVLLITACETTSKRVYAPKPEVTAAEAASAIMEANAAVGRAKGRNNLWRDTSKILGKADKAMAAKKYGDAHDLANKARHQAEASVTQSYRGDALFLITTLRKEYLEQMSIGQKKQLKSAQSALDDDRTQVAYELASEIMGDLRAQMEMAETAAEPEVVATPEPAPAPVMTSYTVNRNDSLWDIAAKPEVYGNADMWPLLWKANKDKIKRPDAIASGLSLIIDRSASDESVAAAIKYSKLRGAPSLGPVDAFDKKFMSE